VDVLIAVLARFGLFLCAVVLAWLAHLLHGNAKGKRKSAKRTVAVLIMAAAGLALMGSVFGGWVTGNIGTVGGFFAAALVLSTVGPTVILWIANGEPNKLAMWCVLGAPLALLLGVGQVVALADELGRQGERVGDTVQSITGR
jgi:hypothetical protein